MLKKYFVTTLRYLWRQRLFTILNILGLSISISACWVIYRIIDYEFSYERKIPNKENIYRLITGFIFDEKERYNGGVSKPMYQVIREQIGNIDLVVPVFEQNVKLVEANKLNSKPLTFEDQKNIIATDSSYFSMLPYHWLSGNKLTAFKSPQSVVLTESRANQYFPGKKPDEIINETITYYSRKDTIKRIVTGIVVPDFDAPTEFIAKEFFSLPTKSYDLTSWTNTNGSDKLYLQLQPTANTSKIIKQIDDILLQKRKQFQQLQVSDFKLKEWYELMPLKESHFSTYIDEWYDGTPIRKANKKILFGLMGIAVFLLLLACINYINMSLASIPYRTKEIGVRITLGSSRTQLIAQFLYETLIIAIIAGAFSFVLSNLFFGVLSDIIPQGITPFNNILQLIYFIIILAIIISILAGLYPAWLVTKIRPINVFKSTSLRTKKVHGFNLQKSLIVFQFTIALIFIISSIVIGKQLHYAITADMGFNKDAVVLVDVPWKYASDKKYEHKQFSLFNELKTIPGIQNISLGNAPMEDNYSSSIFEYIQDEKEPVKREVFRKNVDTSYLNLYGIKLIAGRNFITSDTTNELVINETAVKGFGFKSPQEAVSKLIGQQKDAMLPIVGVVKDFHMENFYSAITPMAFVSEKNNLLTFNIKLNKDVTQWQKTLKEIEKKWGEFYPPPTFTSKFYDESIEQMYQDEKHMAKLIDLATFISIFISCLGLFGIAVLTIYQRTKEIGIRKILGAPISAIVKLLTIEYILLIIISIAISTPVAWWAMNKWLQKFAYRINISWWVFLLAGLIALLIALITVSYQAIKAAIVNPVKSLRTE